MMMKSILPGAAGGLAVVVLLAVVGWIPGLNEVPLPSWSLWHQPPYELSNHFEVALGPAVVDTTRFGFVADKVLGFTMSSACSVAGYIDPDLVIEDTSAMNDVYSLYVTEQSAAADTMVYGPRIGESKLDLGFRYIPPGGEFNLEEPFSGLIVKEGASGDTLRATALGNAR